MDVEGWAAVSSKGCNCNSPRSRIAPHFGSAIALALANARKNTSAGRPPMIMVVELAIRIAPPPPPPIPENVPHAELVPPPPPEPPIKESGIDYR